MTTPSERARALRFAGEVLAEVRRDQGLPDSLRHQARVTLRHYPSAPEIAAMARIESRRAEAAANPLFPAWLAPESSAASAEEQVEASEGGELARLTNLLQHIRQFAWIAYADGRTLEDKDAALHEILKLTREVGNEPPGKPPEMKS